MMLFKRFRSLFRLARPHRGKLIGAGVCSVLAGLIGIIPFVLVSELGRLLIEEGVSREKILVLAVWALGAIVARYVLVAAGRTMSHLAAYMTMYDLQLKLAQKIGTMPLGAVSARGSAALKKTIMQDTDIMHTILGHYIDDFLTGTVVPLATLLVFFWVDWRLALAAAAVIPFLYMAHRASFRDFAAEGEAYFKADEHMQASLNEYVNGISVVKTFNRDLSRGLCDAVGAQVRHMLHWNAKTINPWAAFNVLADASLLFILPAGLWMVAQGMIGPQTLLLFLLMGIGYLQPLVRLSIQIGFLNYASKSIERIEDLLESRPLAPAAAPRMPQGNDVAVRGVSFAYEGKRALSGVSLEIPAGTLCAIVGPSGAGKSTLAQLIGRFWDVDEGAITIGGVDLRDMAEDELYRRVAFVFQDVFLFNGSVADNLRLARPEATDEEIIRAARAARAHDFIMQMPGGYDAPVGERGALLSGGQKQRLSIARAILRDAPILVLDEATAYADPINEVEIQRALGALMRGRTVIMIAHRLSTIRHADQIVVLNHGALAGTGAHEALLRDCPLYATLWADYAGAGVGVDAGAGAAAEMKEIAA